MDFGDVGDQATFPHAKDTFPMSPAIDSIALGNKDGQTAGKVIEALICNWVAIFGTAYIRITDNDTWFTGSIFQGRCRECNTTMGIVTP